jgi:hypothetical protein
MNPGRKITFWVVLSALPPVAALIGLYFISYFTISPSGVSVEGDSIVAYDQFIGFVPRPASRTKRTDLATLDRPAFSYNIFTDERGARITIAGQSSPARIDVMTIGCSFTWGHGFENEQTFAAIVASRLGVSGSNFAMGSYGTVQSLLMLSRNLDLSPKLVVYGFITDHLRRNVVPCAPSYYPFCLDVAHVTWGRDDRPKISPPLTDGVKRIQLQMKAEAGMLDPITWVTHGLDVAFGRMIWRMGLAGEPDDTRKKAALEYLLKEMARAVDGIGAKLLIVYIPTDYTPPPTVLLRLVTTLNVPLVDMTDDFRRNYEAPGTAPVYIPGDGHPSIAGHALIAEKIIRTVQQEGLLGRRMTGNPTP